MNFACVQHNILHKYYIYIWQRNKIITLYEHTGSSNNINSGLLANFLHERDIAFQSMAAVLHDSTTIIFMKVFYIFEDSFRRFVVIKCQIVRAAISNSRYLIKYFSCIYKYI